MEKFESAVQAGNLSLQHEGEATPANTITVMSIDHSSGTTGKYLNFDAPMDMSEAYKRNVDTAG